MIMISIQNYKNQSIQSKNKNTESFLNSYRQFQTHLSKFYTLFKRIYDGAFPGSRVKCDVESPSQGDKWAKMYQI